MDYKELNDNELIYLCAENNEDAQNILVEKYKPCIYTILKELLNEYDVKGVETSDLYQEGYLGILKAIKSYDPNKETLFYTYVNACIKRTLFTAIRRTFRKKNIVFNNSCSLDSIIDDESSSTYYDLFKDETSDPNNVLMLKEEKDIMINSLKNKLSKSEFEIFDLRLKGLSNVEIADIISKDKKYVENTIFRINKKYKELIEN